MNAENQDNEWTQDQLDVLRDAGLTPELTAGPDAFTDYDVAMIEMTAATTTSEEAAHAAVDPAIVQDGQDYDGDGVDEPYDPIAAAQAEIREQEEQEELEEQQEQTAEAMGDLMGAMLAMAGGAALLSGLDGAEMGGEVSFGDLFANISPTTTPDLSQDINIGIGA